MKAAIKFAIYFLIIASEIDYLWSRPIESNNNLIRKKRQVVQPKWLSGSGSKKIDPNVRVNEQNLKEAAAIRDAIQKAIMSGTFFVDTDEPEIPNLPESKPKPKPKPKTKAKPKTTKPKPKSSPRPSFPKFEMPQFDLSQFEISEFDLNQFGFELPEFEMADFHPSNWNFDFIDQQDRNEMLQEIHRLWEQFWVTSRKVLNLGS